MKKTTILLTALVLAIMSVEAEVAYVTGQTDSTAALTQDGTEDSVTSAEFAAGLGNQVVIAVTIKTIGGETKDPLKSVTYGEMELTEIVSHVITDGPFDLWTYIYAGAAEAAKGDVVVSYAYTGLGKPWDTLSICASSWSGTSGFSLAAGKGGNSKDGRPLSTSLNTTQDHSVIISSAGLGYGPLDGFATTRGAIVLEEYTKKGAAKNYGLLLSQKADAAGSHTQEVSWKNLARRSVIISAELLEQ